MSPVLYWEPWEPQIGDRVTVIPSPECDGHDPSEERMSGSVVKVFMWNGGGHYYGVEMDGKLSAVSYYSALELERVNA